jgi:N-acetylneuraminic acid mutarotase
MRSHRGWSLGAIAAAGMMGVLGCRDAAEPATSPTVPATENSSALAAASNSWSTRAPFSPVPDCCLLDGYTVGTAPNSAGESIVYVIGGERDPLDEGENRTGWPTWRYNVETNSWFAIGPTVHASDLNGAGKIGNKLYITGGSTFGEDESNFPHIRNRTLAYNVNSQTLQRKADMPMAGEGGVTGVIHNQLYVLLGLCSTQEADPGHCDTGGISRPTRAFFRYDPASNSWITRRSAPHFHSNGAAAVINDKLYVVGGMNGLNRLADLDVYDPATNQWQTRAPIPAPGDQLYGTAMLNRFYVISWSIGSGSVIIKFYSYDPATNQWTTRATPPAGVGPIVRVFVNGQPRIFMPLQGIRPEDGPVSGHSYLYTP